MPDLSPNDLAALELAADLAGRYGRDGLAKRLRRIARAKPEPAGAGPVGEVAAIAQQVRALDDLGVYSIFVEAEASSLLGLLCARVRARAERAMRRRT